MNTDIFLTGLDIVYKVASVATLGFLTYQIKQTSNQINQANQSNKLAYTQFEDKRNEDRIRHQKDEREKAIEMAELYANELIGNISYLSEVYRECGVSQYFKHLSFNDIKNFDVYELSKFIKGKIEIEELSKMTKKIDLEILVDASQHLNKDGREIVDDGMEIINLKNFIDNYEAKKEAAITSEEVQTKESEDVKGEYIAAKLMYKKYDLYYNGEFKKILCQTLNQLEYFCMYFNSGVADEETVYQSLHQSFLEMIKIVYFKIASGNKTGKDKYYTNIIKLYNKWSERYAQCIENEIKLNRNNSYEQDEIKK